VPSVSLASFALGDSASRHAQPMQSPRWVPPHQLNASAIAATLALTTPLARHAQRARGAGQGYATTAPQTHGLQQCRAFRLTAHAPQAIPDPTEGRAQRALLDSTSQTAALERAPHAPWGPAQPLSRPLDYQHAPFAATVTLTHMKEGLNALHATQVTAQIASDPLAAHHALQEAGPHRARPRAFSALGVRIPQTLQPQTSLHANCAKPDHGQRTAHQRATTVVHVSIGAGQCASSRHCRERPR